MAADRRIFHDMIEELLPFLMPIWQMYNSQIVQIFTTGAGQYSNMEESQVTNHIEKAVLVLKVIRKAIINGLKKPCENQNAMILIQSLIQQIRVVLPFRKFLFLITRKNLVKIHRYPYYF